MPRSHHLTIALTLVLAGCSTSGPYQNNRSNAPAVAFFGHVAQMCGAVFEGYSSFPDDPQHDFYGLLLRATIRDCEENIIRMPFQVGDDHSRTWILSRTDEQLLFKHDHRHEDGTPDEVTNYGGNSDARGTPLQQFFPADAETAALLPEAATNVWSLTLAEDGSTLTYDLQRHAQPRFRAVLKRVNQATWN